MNAHVVHTPSGDPVSGITVNFYTTLGTLSTTSGSTNSNGDIGTTLWGGWSPGSATVRAQVTANGTDYSDVAIIPVVKPNGETTHISGRIPPLTQFSQNLTPGDVDFSGLYVTERSGGGNDQCYWQGSAAPIFDSVTGGTWLVGANNAWGADHLSWGGYVEYYREAGRAPCGTTLTQHMDVVRPSGNLYYTSNSGPLVLTINVTNVQNTRDAVTDTIPYP